jgi:hypothetical protein
MAGQAPGRLSFLSPTLHLLPLCADLISYATAAVEGEQRKHSHISIICSPAQLQHINIKASSVFLNHFRAKADNAG